MNRTRISWCDMVWNPTVGCTKVSQGCKFCYAEKYFKRFHAGEKFSEVKCHEERLNWVNPRQKRRFVFVDSMSDLFHEDVPDEFILQVWERMMSSPQHIFLILTKRPQRMMEWVNNNYQIPLPNIWMGVSVEDQATADERIPWLLRTPAAVRFISLEPMLENIIIKNYLWPVCWTWDSKYKSPEEALAAGAYAEEKPQGFIYAGRNFIDWVICGCETGGPYARPMELDWARSLRDQCQAAGVPFFLKQAVINGKLNKEPELDGRTWRERPWPGQWKEERK